MRLSEKNAHVWRALSAGRERMLRPATPRRRRLDKETGDMAELRRPLRSALVTLASTVILSGLSAVWATPAHADVIVAVRGEACGYVTNVGLFGGAQAKLGCEPQAG